MYRVVVGGQVGPALLGCVDGFILESAGEESVLIGEEADQADLYGLLLVLQRFGVPLRSVQQL